jgi:excinuclease UvrABC ATPase subunit
MKNQKKICPRCSGNGYIKVKESIERPIDIVVQCPMCNSKGEVYDKEFDDYFDSHVELKSLLKH